MSDNVYYNTYSKLEKYNNKLSIFEEHLKKTSELNELNSTLVQIQRIKSQLFNLKITGEYQELELIRTQIISEYRYLELELLNKIRSIKQDNFEKVVDKMIEKDPNVENGIKNELKKFQEDLKKIDANINDKFKIEKDNLFILEKKEDLKMKRNEHWANIINGFIKKESISSLLGGVLLFVYGIGLLIAMFKKVETSQIIQSAFLIILGYFFGHSTNKNKDE